MVLLGIVITVLGVIFILLGVIGAAKDVFLGQGKGFAAADAKIIELFLKVILQVLQGPSWLIMTVVGAILVYIGHQLSTGGWPFSA